ncbi:Protein ABHD11 like protein [Argiope bruennichi]|uniref:sn-1-specific diacylglycerol lipase ABHD11 n=1 Tax=Argiope bruennichi TaxID=94029 RepID=A0A8T0E9B4_ARGBR|nr:Protein ABHD11 like protein [Argiope bruennichi]
MKCPIIFVHGFFTTNRSWNIVKHKIANKTKRKVYSIDLRNHGQSEYSEHFTVKYVMADIENFMKSQHIAKAVLVAHSIGSKPMMALALEKPELVEKLVVEDMVVEDPENHPEVTKKMLLFTKVCDRYIRNAPANMPENELHQRILPLVKQFYPEVSESYSLTKLPLKKDQSGKLTWDLNVNAVMDHLENPVTFRLNLSSNPKYLGNILFLYGEKSPIKIEENKDIALKYFPNAQFYVFKGGFHTFSHGVF